MAEISKALLVLKNDVVEFTEDYSVLIGGTVGRVEIKSGKRALVVRGMEDPANKIEIVILLPKHNKGKDVTMRVGAWALKKCQEILPLEEFQQQTPEEVPDKKTVCLACNNIFYTNETECPFDFTTLLDMRYNEAPTDLVLNPGTDWEMNIEDTIFNGRVTSIWKAKRKSNGRSYAVKILPAECANPEDYARSIKKEVRTLQKALHPNVVKVYHYGKLNNTRPYFVMEYVNGEPLSKHLKLLPLQKAKSISLTLARAMSFLHRNEILHPALTASDILLIEKEPHFKLIDFGDTRIVGHKNGTYSINGVLGGDFRSLSPEILQSKENSKASNVYSVAAIIYEALTSVSLFPGELNSMMLATKIASSPVAHISTVRPDLNFEPAIDQILSRCLSKDPADRPPVVDLLTTLSAVWPDI